MIGFVLAMMIGFDASVVVTDAEAEARHWGEFSRSEALRRNSVRVLIGSLGYDRTTRTLATWMRRERRDTRGEARVDWADSRSCPAMRRALTAMRALPRPAFQPPGSDDGDLSIILDGVGYRLTAPAGYDNVVDSPLTISSNVQTPLAKWVDDSLASLEPCWSAKPPSTIAR